MVWIGLMRRCGDTNCAMWQDKIKKGAKIAAHDLMDVRNPRLKHEAGVNKPELDLS